MPPRRLSAPPKRNGRPGAYVFSLARERFTQDGIAEGVSESWGPVVDDEGAESLREVVDHHRVRARRWAEGGVDARGGAFSATSAAEEHPARDEVDVYSLRVRRGDGRPVTAADAAYLRRALGLGAGGRKRNHVGYPYPVGTLVAERHGRPHHLQPWVHPKYSGDPDDPGHGWTAEIIAYNDPRLWEDTLAFPGRRPAQAEVDAHIARHAELGRRYREELRRIGRTPSDEGLRTPVLWEHGRAELVSGDQLFPVPGPVVRKGPKRNRPRRAARGRR